MEGEIEVRSPSKALRNGLKLPSGLCDFFVLWSSRKEGGVNGGKEESLEVKRGRKWMFERTLSVRKRKGGRKESQDHCTIYGEKDVTEPSSKALFLSEDFSECSRHRSWRIPVRSTSEGTQYL